MKEVQSSCHSIYRGGACQLKANSSQIVKRYLRFSEKHRRKDDLQHKHAGGWLHCQVTICMLKISKNDLKHVLLLGQHVQMCTCYPL